MLVSRVLFVRRNGIVYPDIETSLNQGKRKTSFLVGQTHPHLTVHEQTMMQVDDPLLDTIFTTIHLLILLAPFPTKSVQAQEIPIPSLYYMLFSVVAI